MSHILKERVSASGCVVQVARGDITEERVDAVVNAANARLDHGAGVAGAIVRRGGGVIQVESKRWVEEHGPVTHAEPAYTHAGELACRYVIHAVGPVWGEGQEEEKLRSAIDGCLRLADRLNLVSIAFPAISTGIFGFPKEIAARVILTAIIKYIESNPGSSLKLVRSVVYDPATVQAFLEVWEQDDHLSA